MKAKLMYRMLRGMTSVGVCAGLVLSVSHAQDKPADPKPTMSGDLRITKTKPVPAKVPFLGLALGAVDEALAAQINLPEGVGVLVRAVLDDSPAGKAGVRQHDVLHYFNDQLLVNEPQVQTLVRRAGIGADVTLKLLRKGREETVTLKLGEHDELVRSDVLHMRAREPGDRRIGAYSLPLPPGDGRMFNFPLSGDGFANQVRELSERMKELEGKPEMMRKEIERFRVEVQEQADKARDAASKQADAARKNMEAQREYGIGWGSGAKTKVWKDDKGGIRVEVFGDAGKAEGGAQGSVTATADGQGNVVVTHTNTTRMAWNDGDGSGELLIENGKKKLTVKDLDGKEIFSGPVDTDEDRKSLPDKVRERLERLERDVKLKGRSDEKEEKGESL